MKALASCVLVLAALGCGSSQSVVGWVGSWNASVAETETCSASSGNHTTGLNGPVAIVAGSASGTIITEPANGCDLTWTVSGSSATLTSSQMCNPVPTVTPGTWTATFTTGLLTLNGNTIGVTDSGSAIYLPTGGATQNCTFNQSGSFTLD
jgi:hypothetical protein